jgi:phage terminase large subunit GpA-like protein
MSSIAAYPDIARVVADTLRPPEDLSFAEIALKYRVLHSVYCTEHPGKFTFDLFPWQKPSMNRVELAIKTGKKGHCTMAAGQIGKTDKGISDLLSLKIKYPGPQLFLTTTDTAAEEFGRDRFKNIIPDMPPLACKYISGKGGLTVMRFTDGPIRLAGGKSINNLLSFPYRFVAFDELGSIIQNLAGQGDPIALARIRGDSFVGSTLILAWEHPTNKKRGAGKIYYELSDQARAFIVHLPSVGGCGKDFWLDWHKIVKATPRFDGQTQEQADHDPDCYAMHCPHCGEKISDAQRVLMLRAGIEMKSTLPPEVAAAKEWLGDHASQLYSPHKTLREFSKLWIEALGDENKMIVFVNKVLGDCHESKTKKVDVNSLRDLIVRERRRNDPDFYRRGQIPPGVLFLTAGQDSRTIAFHYAIWGWGIREGTDRVRRLCRWLIDWGEIQRGYSLSFDESEFHIFDSILYRRRFPSSVNSDRLFDVRMGMHDIGWAPTQIPIIRYCRSFAGRAFPARGASETMTSADTAPYVRLSAARKSKVGDDEVFDDGALLLNTFTLKTQWYGDVERRFEVVDFSEGKPIGTRKVPIMSLPADVDELFLHQTANEFMGKDEDGNDVWQHQGPNHIADCNMQAYAAALHLDPHAQNQTAEEYEAARRQNVNPPEEFDDDSNRGENFDPSLG